MHGRLPDVAKEGQKGLLMLAELAQHAAAMGEMSIPSLSPTSQKRIIMACLALHNFIRKSNLRDKEFERCDTNEDYLIESVNNDDEEEEEESQDVENDDTMNIIRTRIADALVSASVG
jgi:hypothetical protein